MTLNSSHPAILLIEDDQEIRESLQDVLEMEGYTIDQAINGKEGLSKLDRISPKLILLDLNMPVMDGMEFLKQREEMAKLKNIPVLVLSAAGDTRRQEAAKYANMVLKKPIDLHQMLDAIESFVSPK